MSEDLPVSLAPSPAPAASREILAYFCVNPIPTQRRYGMGFFGLMILTETELILGKLNPGLVDRALAQLRQDKLPLDLLVDIQHIPLDCITEVRQNIYSLTFYYTQENEPTSADIILNNNKATTMAMLRALAYRLSKLPEGSAVRLTKGLNRLTWFCIYVIVVLVLSIFLWLLPGHR